MTNGLVKNLVENGYLKNSNMSRIYTISNTDQHLITENPLECCANLIEFIHKTEEKHKFLWNARQKELKIQKSEYE